MKHLEVPEAGRGQKESSLETSKEVWPCQHVDFSLVASRAVKESISIALSHLVCDTVLCYIISRVLIQYHGLKVLWRFLLGGGVKGEGSQSLYQ
jgi:hypothetical protein